MSIDYSKPITSFKELVDALSDLFVKNEVFLPICHTPKIEYLSDITFKKKLEPRKGNKHYAREKLVFFYYGKISYIPKDKAQLQSDFHYPLSFVFDLAQIKIKPKRILPFDSGGSALYKMGKFVPKNFEINKPLLIDLKKLVYLLFNTSKEYIEFKPAFEELSKNCIFLPALTELLELYKGILGRTQIGKQGASFELHFARAIALKPQKVVCQPTFLTSEFQRQQFESLFIDKEVLLPYETHKMPQISVENMNKALVTYLKQKHSELN